MADQSGRALPTPSSACPAARTGIPCACPLCEQTGDKTPVHGADTRRYLLCPPCGLIFVDQEQHLSLEQEKARYQQHHNTIKDRGYIHFLEQVLQPMLPHLAPTMRGLDYGCGPNPVLAQMIRQRGLHCDVYDPLFANHPLQPPYDFILSTECFEHFRNPQQEITRICGLLSPGGLLGIMTELWTSLNRFATWAYTRDRTHVAFYHLRTLHCIAARFGFNVLWNDGCRVAIFRRHLTGANT